MSCIHFKFKSNLEYEKVSFGGLQISLGELKEAIMKQKKIGGANQYALSVKDAQSKKLYKDDNEMLSRNSSVIISRVPLVNAPKIPKTQNQDPSLPQPASSRAVTGGIPSTALPALTSASETVQDGKLSAEQLAKMPDLSKANATEEEKMIAMMNQSSEDYNPSRYVKFTGPRRGGGGGGGMMMRGGGAGGGGGATGGMMMRPPPPTYRCYRCGQQGHFINQCPTNGDPKFDNYRYKPVRGTPSNQLIPASGDVQGAMMDRHGNLVVRAVDYQAFLNSQMKGKKTGAAVEAPKVTEIPPELLCHLCKELVRDAVIIPCCGESFCYECIQDHLCENEFTCPMCKVSDVSPERLAPNKALRTAAKNFQLKAAEEKSEAVARGFVKQAPLTSRLPAPTPTPPHTTSMASTTLTTSASQSQDSTSSTITEINSPRNNDSTTDGPSDKTANQPASPASGSSDSNTMVTATSPVTPPPDPGLLTQANIKLEKIMLDGLAGISSAGSVPVMKVDPRAHLMHPIYPPTHSAHLLAPSLLPQPRLTRFLSSSAAADLLLGRGKTSPSPPPLSADEFYRQQKLFKLLTKKTGSRSNTPGSNSSWSGSDTGSNSRSRSRSWSYDSRSRSRSPHQKKHKTSTRKIKTHPHKRSRHVQERETERTTKHRSHRKHPHSKEKKEEVSKRTTKRHRSRSVSPERKRPKVDNGLSRNDGPSEGEENGSHKHKHKKRSKRKHRQHRAREEEVTTTPLIDAIEVGGSQSQEQATSEPSTMDNSEASSLKETEQASPDIEGESLETNMVQEHSKSDSDELNNNNSMEKAVDSILVPYQDTSTTEAELNEDTQTAASSDDDDGVLEVHIDGDIDGLDQELGVVLAEVTPPETDKVEGGGKEDGEISDSGGSRPITPYVAQQTSHTPKPLSPEEDLRAEIERAKKKRELENIEPLPSSIPLEAIPIPKTIVHAKVKKRKPAPVSSDEYDSSSSSSESEDSEAERIARKKLQKLKQRSKRKHSSSSKNRDRREKAVKSKKKKEHSKSEHSKSKKDSRDRKVKKAKSHRDEYKIKKVDKAKKSKSSRH